LKKRKQEASVHSRGMQARQSAFLADVEKTLVGQEQMSVVPKQED
jgi:hypothetical protein